MLNARTLLHWWTQRENHRSTLRLVPLEANDRLPKTVARPPESQATIKLVTAPSPSWGEAWDCRSNMSWRSPWLVGIPIGKGRFLLVSLIMNDQKEGVQMNQAERLSSPVDASPYQFVVGIDVGSQTCSICGLKPVVLQKFLSSTKRPCNCGMKDFIREIVHSYCMFYFLTNLEYNSFCWA